MCNDERLLCVVEVDFPLDDVADFVEDLSDECSSSVVSLTVFDFVESLESVECVCRFECNNFERECPSSSADFGRDTFGVDVDVDVTVDFSIASICLEADEAIFGGGFKWSRDRSTFSSSKMGDGSLEDIDVNIASSAAPLLLCSFAKFLSPASLPNRLSHDDIFVDC